MDLVIGRQYHVRDWKHGSTFVLSAVICDGSVAVLRTPKKGKEYSVPVTKLEPTRRYKEQ